MERIVKFEEIADEFIQHGSPSYIYINKKDSQVIANTLKTYYEENQCNKVFTTGHLGYLKDVPVLPGVVSTQMAKLCWK